MSLNMEMKILVVDDNNTMRGIFKQMLKKAGFENVILAEDGMDALEKLKENEVDLIISDWNMPNMDGMELLQWVRKEETKKDIPFIMATAQGDKTQQNHVKSEGGNGHISKPFTPEQIAERINIAFGLQEKETGGVRKPVIVDGKVEIDLAHIQITDHLILGVLKYLIQSGNLKPEHFSLKTECMAGWNPVQESLENGKVDGAFVLAPMAMDLFAFDTPIKLVLLAHKNGSSFVRSKDGGNKAPEEFFKDKTIYMPHKMSVHNMLAHEYLTEIGLKPGVPGKEEINVTFEVIPPVKMPGTLAENDDAAGFIVAEPIASKAVATGIADMEFLSSSRWDNHPCCVVVMRDEIISEHPEAVQELVSMLVEAGRYIDENALQSGVIAVNFLDPQKKLGLNVSVLETVLKVPGGIKMGDLYPVAEDFEKIQRYMHDEMGIGKLIDVEKLVDLRFADKACRGDGERIERSA